VTYGQPLATAPMQYSYIKQLQSQTVSREKLQKTLSYEKAAHKMLVKLTSEVSWLRTV